MPNNKWDDENIESLLKDFPTIKDERPKEEVYKRLQKTQKPQKKSKHWIPYLVAALAFITFGVLLASMLGQSSNESAYDMSGSEGEGAEESTTESGDAGSAAVEDNGGGESESESAATESSEAEDAGEGSDAFSATENNVEMAENSLYEDQLDGMSLFTVGLTENAIVVPVSFVVWHDRLLEDFGTLEVDAVDLYNRYAPEIDEEALGFDEYHPYAGTIEKTAEGLVHRLPENHNYDLASASMTVYFNSLAATFKDAEGIAVVDEAGKAADFDQVGPVEPLEPGNLNLAYYTYDNANGSSYLVPGFNMPHESAAEALEAMKSTPNDLYSTVIPAGVEYSVSETDQMVTVEFNEPADFDSYGYQEAINMIEGMVLAADSFGKELMLENTADENWGNFDFTAPLPVPAGINIKEYGN
ncbi:hypothetical protein [Planococcus halotolerans]|uniref:GerMN domain-containing protein n=1 Tax=Planococcus halotolerans TaxID=2233542 RepID=A0A365L119_9BACL|nr:hypothetical protein [Planococcus halotolerans]QHJ71108.1 hypothetical protein DNR44_010985 [Planococcus halotolerans]RAZ79131.1 hypothetical protein DP120_05810 [Planococcus halotolerans]